MLRNRDESRFNQVAAGAEEQSAQDVPANREEEEYDDEDEDAVRKNQIWMFSKSPIRSRCDRNGKIVDRSLLMSDPDVLMGCTSKSRGMEFIDSGTVLV